MKDVTGVVTRSGNVNSKGEHKGSISEAGMGVVMQILSQMYTNAPLAVLREYSCNARDSHVAAGQARPIEVTLPSDMQPTLLIQDFGLGLSEEEALTFFLEYGESTKRDSDEQVGAFGIGSKSAFTMGHQFVVTAIKDGQKVVILLSLDENSVCQADVIRRAETDEPNGVLISLAVEDVDTMRETAEYFFSFWERGTVLVDGEEPTPVWEGKTEINDHTWILPDHEGQVIVAMGGVPYVLGRDILRKVARDLAAAEDPAAEQAKALVDWYSDTTLLFKVAIGDCHIAPNREGLRDTQRSLETVKALLGDLVGDLAKSVQAKVDQAPNAYQAALVLRKALDDLGPFKVRRDQINYVGGTLKKEVKIDLPVVFLRDKSWRSNVKVVATDDDFTVDDVRANQVLVVTGVAKDDAGKVTRYAKRFLENFEADDEDSKRVKWILLSEEAQGEFDWFSYGDVHGARFLTLEGYRAALRSMRESNPRTKNEPSYTTGFSTASRDLEDRDLLTDIISWGKDIIIFHESARLGSLAREALKDYTIVVLLATQSENALRKRVEEDGSVAIFDGDYMEIVKAHARKVFESVTEDEKAALGAIQWLDAHDDREWRNLARALGAENITSPAYHEAVDAFALARLVAADISDDRKNLLAQAARYIGAEVEYPEYDVEIKSVRETWPLVGYMVNYHGSWVFEREEDMKAEALAIVNAK